MIAYVPLSRITHNPWQTRQGEPDPEYIRELAEDIQVNGLLQTPTGRLVGAAALADGDVNEILAADSDAMVQLAFGHNRLAAYRLNHERSASPVEICMPVNVRELSDEKMADFAWSENEKRRDVTPLERARALQQRIADFGWTQEQAARHTGMSRPAVSNTLRLLNLSEKCAKALETGQISERQAAALVGYQDKYESITGIAPYVNDADILLRGVIDNGWSSDYIRQKADSLIEQYANGLSKAAWTLDDMLVYDGFRSPTCRDCEARDKHTNRCLDRDCYNLRKATWIANRCKPWVEASGIPMLEDDRKSYSDHVDFAMYALGAAGSDQRAAALTGSGCENLRLMYEPATNDWRKNNPARLVVQGQPTDCTIVCCKARQHCKCLAGVEHLKESGAPAPEAVTASDLEEQAKQARVDAKQAKVEMKDLATAAALRIAEGLVEGNPSTWFKLMRKLTYTSETTPYMDAWTAQLKIAEKIVEGVLPEKPQSTRAVVKDLNGLLEVCGLELLDEPGSLVDVFAKQEVEP